MKSSGRGSRRNTAIRFLTWKDMAERRNEVMDMVAQVVSWAKAGGTNRFVRLPMSLIRPRACEPSEPNEDTTKVKSADPHTGAWGRSPAGTEVFTWTSCLKSPVAVLSGFGGRVCIGGGCRVEDFNINQSEASRAIEVGDDDIGLF